MERFLNCVFADSEVTASKTVATNDPIRSNDHDNMALCSFQLLFLSIFIRIMNLIRIVISADVTENESLNSSIQPQFAVELMDSPHSSRVNKSSLTGNEGARRLLIGYNTFLWICKIQTTRKILNELLPNYVDDFTVILMSLSENTNNDITRAIYLAGSLHFFWHPQFIDRSLLGEDLYLFLLEKMSTVSHVLYSNPQVLGSLGLSSRTSLDTINKKPILDVLISLLVFAVNGDKNADIVSLYHQFLNIVCFSDSATFISKSLEQLLYSPEVFILDAQSRQCGLVVERLDFRSCIFKDLSSLFATPCMIHSLLVQCFAASKRLLFVDNNATENQPVVDSISNIVSVLELLASRAFQVDSFVLDLNSWIALLGPLRIFEWLMNDLFTKTPCSINNIKRLQYELQVMLYSLFYLPHFEINIFYLMQGKMLEI